MQTIEDLNIHVLKHGWNFVGLRQVTRVIAILHRQGDAEIVMMPHQASADNDFLTGMFKITKDIDMGFCPEPGQPFLDISRHFVLRFDSMDEFDSIFQ